MNVLKKTTWNLCWYGIFEPMFIYCVLRSARIFSINGFGIYRSLASCVQLWRWLFGCGLNLDWVWNNLKASAWLGNDLYSAMKTFHVFTCIRFVHYAMYNDKCLSYRLEIIYLNVLTHSITSNQRRYSPISRIFIDWENAAPMWRLDKIGRHYS